MITLKNNMTKADRTQTEAESDRNIRGVVRTPFIAPDVGV